MVAAVVWQVLLGVGRLLVEHSLHGANQVYGAFATVIGLLAWFAIQAQVTLYAVELDVVRAHRLVPRSLAPPLTEADERALTSYAAAQARVADQQRHRLVRSRTGSTCSGRRHQPSRADRTSTSQDEPHRRSPAGPAVVGHGGGRGDGAGVVLGTPSTSPRVVRRYEIREHAAAVLVPRSDNQDG